MTPIDMDKRHADILSEAVQIDCPLLEDSGDEPSLDQSASELHPQPHSKRGDACQVPETLVDSGPEVCGLLPAPALGNATQNHSHISQLFYCTLSIKCSHDGRKILQATLLSLIAMKPVQVCLGIECS